MPEITQVGALSMEDAVAEVRSRMTIQGQDWLDACYNTFCGKEAGITSMHGDEWVALLNATRNLKVVV